MRKPTVLDISPSLRKALSTLKVDREINAPSVIPSDEIEAVERAIGCAVPDEILAVYATFGRPLTAVVEYSMRAADDGLPRWLVPVSYDNGDYWCFERGKLDARVALCSVEGDLLRMSGESSDWLLIERALAQGLVLDWTAHPPRGAATGHPDFPHIVAPVRATAPHEEWVWHRKFGRGKVTRRYAGGKKLDVEFDDRDRTLLARFVRPT